MGTRRSKHNYGRKPLYKDRGGETIRRFSEPASRQSEKVQPVIARIPDKIEIKLAPEVQKYLEDNTPVQRAEVKRPSLPQLVDAGEWTDRHYSISRRDLLVQMFADRKINTVQLGAGRLWQHYMEECILQANVSIDPGAPLNKQMWQRDGDMTDQQYRAMMVRKIVTPVIGTASVKFLDLVLQPDVGRKEASELCRMRMHHIEYALHWLLSGLAIYFGKRTCGSEVFAPFAEACARLSDYRWEWQQEVLTITGAQTLMRTMNYAEQQANKH